MRTNRRSAAAFDLGSSSKAYEGMHMHGEYWPTGVKRYVDEAMC